MKISLNPKVKIDFKKFVSMFGKKFLHIPEKDREKAMKTEYDRAVKERGPVKIEKTDSKPE